MYSVEGIEAAASSPGVWIVSIGCGGREAKAAVNQSLLRITIGDEQRDIPVIAVPVSNE
jgi:hypothetical protein